MQTESLTLRSRDPLITGRYPVVLCISVQSRIARKVEMERLLISFAAMLFGATIGYIAVWFLSEMFLPDSKGPGNLWRLAISWKWTFFGSADWGSVWNSRGTRFYSTTKRN